MGTHDAMRTTAIIPALLVLLVLPLAAQTRSAPTRTPVPAQRTVADPLQEAETLLQAQQYAQAEEKLKSLSDSQAKNPQFWFDLGFAQSHQGKTKEAVAAFQKAVELEPAWFEASLNLGHDLAKSGNAAEAVVVLKHTVELKPASGGQTALARAWLSLAQTMEEAGNDLKGAAAAYDRAAELNPGDLFIVVSAGKALERTGDLSAAEQHYVKAAEKGDTAGVTQLIGLLIKQKRYADAEIWLNKYITQNPQDAGARAQAARLLAAQGKRQEAIAMLQPLGGPDANPAIQRELAELYLDNKQYAEATPLLQHLLEKNPNDAQLHMDLGVALLHQLKYAEAQAELLKAVQLKPGLADAYGELAFAAQQNKNYELAIRALDARAKFLPETAGTYWIRAVSFDGLRAYKPAAENYKLFLAASNGKSPDQEFQARHRLIAITPR
jgi:tetratricopeptide (TPR) repeat protein